jgi:hypothetical protein
MQTDGYDPSMKMCAKEFQDILSAGPVGEAKLAKISATLFDFFGITTIAAQTKILEGCGLEPIPHTFPVGFRVNITPPFDGCVS